MNPNEISINNINQVMFPIINELVLPMLWFRHYTTTRNKIDIDVFDREIKKYFDDNYVISKLIPKILFCDDDNYVKGKFRYKYKRLIEEKYQDYVNSSLPVCLDYIRYDFKNSDLEELSKVIDLSVIYKKADIEILNYKFKLQDRLPIDKWERNDKIVSNRIHYQAWVYVEKVCKKIVKCKRDIDSNDIFQEKINDYTTDIYYVIRDNKIVKYNTEQGLYYVPNYSMFI